ncbi:sugar phosphate nucleotidyltransferase [Arsukibacterium sp. MJ3]|uniref:sugar phosphate nucleotidyltransferase n=1 Tax=Arsukibacterium sp. MJ3 TaxID=1632859 RepID=UPI0009E4DFDD|nr:sugar phosphate nucleotidyltransferase [Arsukibacterium sp. MJ3]
MSSMLTVLLAGGCGSRLRPLTLHRAKPMVPFAGCFRIIDFVLSNLLHSGFTDLLVLTQYQAAGLEQYLQQCWANRFCHQGFMHCCNAPSDLAQGTAGAVAFQLQQIYSLKPTHITLLSADHIYKMDYRQLLRFHQQHQAGITVAAVAIPVEHARHFGIIQTDDTGRMIGFIEKPQQTPPCMANRPGYVLASMGNYLFTAKALYQTLAKQKRDQPIDFGHHILPVLYQHLPVYVYNLADNDIPGEQSLAGYWRDVGTLNAYYAAQQDVLNHPDWLQGPNQHWPILSGQSKTSRRLSYQLCNVSPLAGGRPCYQNTLLAADQ